MSVHKEHMPWTLVLVNFKTLFTGSTFFIPEIKVKEFTSNLPKIFPHT